MIKMITKIYHFRAHPIRDSNNQNHRRLNEKYFKLMLLFKHTVLTISD